MRIIKLLIIAVTVLLFSVMSLQGQFMESSFGSEPDVATKVKYDEGIIVFTISVDDDYHITDVKNNFFKIVAPQNDYLEIEEVRFPKGVPYDEEVVFKGIFDVPVKIKALREITEPVSLQFTVSYQMCQEKPQEMCFPPESKQVAVTIDRNFGVSGSTSAVDTVDAEPVDEGFSQWVERVVTRELEKKSVMLFLLVFLAGFLTSLTPCVYPVIPIIMGFIGTRSGKSKLKGFYLSLFFVLGLAIVYTILGVIAATTGSMIGVSFQNPIVVVVIAAIFVAMGLSLAGLFDIPVPTSISSRVQGNYKNEIFGSMVIGGVSAIIAAPCVGPVLIALLSWISQTGNVFLGFWLTFTFSLGMGVIFALVGTFTGILSSMPKAGHWMSGIKHFFAVVLLAAGLYFIFTVTPQWLDLVLGGVFLIAISVFAGLFKSLDEDATAGAKLGKVVVILLLLGGAFTFIKGLDLKYFTAGPSLQPVSTAQPEGRVEKKSLIPWVHSLEEGKTSAKQENKRVMIDTYADWCAACKELDSHTFSEPEVAEALKAYIPVKLDFTAKNEANEELRKSLNVIGMPTIIFLDSEGKELNRFSGFKNKKDFLKFLDKLN